MNSKPFHEWNLHDAAVKHIHIHWEEKSCEIQITVFVASPVNQETTAISHTIHFSAVRAISIPIDHPWGDSNFISTQKTSGKNEYMIEMQSGDVIRILAGGVSLDA